MLVSEIPRIDSDSMITNNLCCIFFLFPFSPSSTALNEKLKEEVQRLKIATGQMPHVNGNPFNRGLPPQFASQQPVLHHFGSHQNQQQQQLHMPQSSSNNGQPHLGFLDFNQRVQNDENCLTGKTSCLWNQEDHDK